MRLPRVSGGGCGFAAPVSSLFVREDIAPDERREQAIEVEILQESRALHRRLDDLEKRDR